MYYENVFSVLQKNNIRYAVAGGVALVLHGVVRFTAYLDLLVDLERENLVRFIETMHKLGYRPRNPVDAGGLLDPATRAQWQREKGMEVFSFVDPAQPNDPYRRVHPGEDPFPGGHARAGAHDGKGNNHTRRFFVAFEDA